MTLATADFPDWGRTVARTTRLLLSDVIGPTVNTETRGPFFVGDVPFLSVLVNSNASGVRCSITFFLDEAMTVTLGRCRAHLRSGNDWAQPIPVQGPWVQLSFDPDPGPTTTSMTVYMTDSGAVSMTNEAIHNRMIAADNVAIALGASVTLDASRVFIGEAHWVGHVHDAPYNARLYVVDSGGTTHLVDRSVHTGGGETRRVFLPGMQPRIVIQNNSGGASTYYAALYHKLPII